MDLAPLRGALPNALDASGLRHEPQPNFEASFRNPALAQQQAPVGPSHAWSSDFLAATPTGASLAARQSSAIGHSAPQRSQAYQPRFQGAMPMMQHGHLAPAHAQQSHLASSQQTDAKGWQDAFTAFDGEAKEAPPSLVQQQIIEEVQAARPDMTPGEADELARTAGRLVSTVEHEQNDKFKQSNFLGLMRKLRDREACIQGTDIVDTPETASMGPRLDKGKGRAVDLEAGQARTQEEETARLRARFNGAQGMQLPPSAQPATQEDHDWLNDMWAEEDRRSEAIEKAKLDQARNAFVGDSGDTAARMREDDLEAREFAKYQGLNANVFGGPQAGRTSRQGEEATVDEDFSNEDFVGRRWEGTQGRGRTGMQTAEWDKLQADWDAFEAGPNGLRAPSVQRPFSAKSVPSYVFQQNNPYLESTRHHMAHNPQILDEVPEDLRSMLESEAAVQVDPTNASAWYNLGVKQQENERERSAIAALHRSIQIDPLMKDPWLALAVSYTNEGDRLATFESLERWIDSNDRYADVVSTQRSVHQGASADTTNLSYSERHERLVSTLLSMARHNSQEEVDADVQVALGVLFNASDEFHKAVDCFSAAISVRPDDWLLYNRLGAVLSNSGRSEDALRYYRYALELKPDFARCHFNLAISCLNLKMYAESAEHCYTALALQDAHRAAQSQGGYGGDGESVKHSSSSGGGDNNASLWETMRVALELGGRPDLAERTAKRDVGLFDVSDFGVGAGVEGVDDVAMEPTQ